MKQVSLKLVGIMSCLLILATLPVLAQNAINKKPLQDFAAELNSKLDSKEVDLDKPFSVTLEGYLTKEGRFDFKRSKFIKAEGDKEMIGIAKNAIQAMGDSQILSYLQPLGVEKIVVTLAQDEKDVSFIIICEQPTVEKARVVSSGLSAIFAIAKMSVKESEAKTLLNYTNVSVQDKNCIIKFAMPKSEAHRLLQNELQKAKEKSYSS